MIFPGAGRRRLTGDLRAAIERLEQVRRRSDAAGDETRWLLERAAAGLRDAAPGDETAGRLALRLEILGALAAPRAVPERRPVRLAAPLAELIEAYRAKARADDTDREILYIEDGGGDWLTAAIDRSLFAHAIDELLDNCLRHAGDWSRITVTSEPVDGAVIVRVRDNGCGMPVDVASATGRAGTGAGLGLFVARRIIEAHGGGIEVSTDPGHGTKVSTRWPTEAAPSEGDPT